MFLLKLKFVASSLAFALLLAPSPAQAQSDGPSSPVDHQSHAAQTLDTPAPAHSMMAKHEEMMAAMKALDAKIEVLAATMKTATGEARTDAMAELLNAIIEKQKAMHTCMAAHGG